MPYLGDAVVPNGGDVTRRTSTATILFGGIDLSSNLISSSSFLRFLFSTGTRREGIGAGTHHRLDQKTSNW